MNQLRLSQCLGTVSSSSVQRSHNESLIASLAHRKGITFTYSRAAGSQTGEGDGGNEPGSAPISHHAGVNCLSIDHNEGRYLVSGGADSTIRLWDLEQFDSPASALSSSSSSPATATSRPYSPRASITRSTPSSHTHALTSISIYPFDPTPSTLLTTSYDKCLKVTSITPASLIPIHTFTLDFLPHTHSVSHHPDSSPLIAVGTAHPSVRLLDLRSGLSTHSLSGPNGAIYALAWSPRSSYTLCSGSTDGRVLFYDIRRANAAFASLDLDDAIGVIGDPPSTGAAARTDLLDFSAVAHNGPITSVQWTPSGDRLVTAGHDQRIRVWDTATGRNDLVHFGPRIRNDRAGPLNPLISPQGTHRPGHESLFWPNDDGRGFIFQHHLREGQLQRILRTEGVKLADVQARTGAGGSTKRGGSARLTSGGRINSLVWRLHAPVGDGVEMYSAHGDGRICAWTPSNLSADDEDEVEDGTVPDPVGGGVLSAPDEAEQRRKRKRALIEDLVGGLTRRPVTFS